MSKPRKVRTVGGLIRALGGDAVVANWLGISVAAIESYRQKGIPPGWHLRLYLQAQELGHQVDPKLFGYHYGPRITERHACE